MNDNPSEDGKTELRREIARANGFELFKKYNPDEAADILDIHPQSLKKMRLGGRIAHMRISARKVAFFGFHLADYMIEVIQWASPSNQNSASENTGLERATDHRSGADIGTTLKQNAPAVHRLALQSLKKPSSD